MRYSILKNIERNLARGAALVVVGGLAAGCSSSTTRFQDGIFSGLTPSSNRQVASTSNQPYPGDNVDRMSTGTVKQHVVRPEVPVGRGGLANTAVTSRPYNNGYDRAAPAAPTSRVSSAPLPAPGEAGSRVNRSTAAQPLPAPQATGRDASTRDQAAEGDAKQLTVQSGDTVYSLSRRFDVPVSAILAANNLQSGAQLQAGQTVVIPSYAYSKTNADGGANVARAEPQPSAPREPEPSSNRAAVLPQSSKTRENGTAKNESGNDGASTDGQSSAGTHTVVSGDTLYDISRKTGVSVSRLKEANDLSDGTLHIGQKLKVPGADEATSSRVAKAEPETQNVDSTTTGSSRGSQDADDDSGKVSTYTPPKDDSVGEQAKDDRVASLPNATGVGRLRWPVEGRVISKFGSGSSSSGDGIDIAVPEGTPVKAAENGVVIYAGDGLKEFGNTVLVRHEDGLVTVYGHASKLEVKRGDTVTRGQELARSGMSGNAGRPKVHFEVRKDSAPVDPSKFLD